jgi:GntR family transcriptional regulator, transcriptional repressor for pyruvate dehydrogenase complex
MTIRMIRNFKEPMKHSFKPIKPLRISEEVAQQLKQSILMGHFKPGERLPTERDLSEQFQVSRAATREALRVLENAGFVVTRQGATGGAYVTDLTFDRTVNAFFDLFMADKISIAEINYVRVLVEPDVARLAAERVTDEYVEKLKGSMHAGAGPQFHLILAEMCGNRFLEGLLRSTIDLIGKIVDAASVPYEHPVKDHKMILDAVLAKDGEKAADLMKKHAVANGESLAKVEKLFREKSHVSRQ